MLARAAGISLLPGNIDETRAKVFRRNEGLPGRVWAGSEAVWIPNVLADSSFPRGPLAAKGGLRAAFAFPIRLRNEVIGVIEFFSAQIRQPDEALLEMMSALGVQIGQFIARKEAEFAKNSFEFAERIRRAACADRSRFLANGQLLVPLTDD